MLSLPPTERDAWVSRALELGEIPDDIPLPRGYVPYLPAPVEAILRAVDELPIGSEDVVVDVGSGVGRAAALIQSLSGARVICVELQPQLLAASRALFARLGSERVTHVLGDASEHQAALGGANVFFMYCPFSGAHVERFLSRIRPLAACRELRFACVDLSLPALGWLEELPSEPGALRLFRSR